MDYEIISQKSFENLTGYGIDADEIVKRGVIAGIRFLEENSELNPKRILISDKIYPPMYEENDDLKKLREIISPIMYGGTGSMYEMAVSITMFWKINGITAFLEKLS